MSDCQKENLTKEQKIRIVQEGFLRAIHLDEIAGEVKKLEINHCKNGQIVVELKRYEAFVRFYVGGKIDCSLRMSTVNDTSRWDSKTIFSFDEELVESWGIRNAEEMGRFFESEYCFRELILALAHIPYAWESESMFEYHVRERWIVEWTRRYMMDDYEQANSYLKEAKRYLSHAHYCIDKIKEAESGQDKSGEIESADL